MKRVACVILVGMFFFGMQQAALAVSGQEVSFSETLAGIDGETSGWSVNDTVNDLGRKVWGLLNGEAFVRALGGGNLSHRLTRGLGVWGGENDEIDRGERIAIVFNQPFWLNSFEVRSLFTGEEGGNERGRAKLFRDGQLLETERFFAEEGTGNGVRSVSFTNDAPLVDRIVFSVPGGARKYSEFAVSKLNVTATPEPVSSTLFLLGGGVLAMRRLRRRK